MPTPRYQARDRQIVGRNLPHCSNRPIFCANSNCTVLAGDRPLLRLVKDRDLLGSLRLWVETEQGPLYLHEFARTELTYRADQCRWQLSDPRAAGDWTLTAAAPEGVQGFVLQASCSCPTTLHWQYGGLQRIPGQWNLSPAVHTALLRCDFDAAACAGNRIVLEETGYSLSPALPSAPTVRLTVGSGDASINGAPSVVGSVRLDGRPFYLGAALTPLCDLEAAFSSACLRSDRLHGIFVSDTPDPYLDAQMAVLAAEIDGAWYPPRTMHSNQSWNAPFLGWCNRFGNALGGWFDRVTDELAYYCARQHTADDKQGGAADPARLLTEAGPDSRFYGLGHIDADQFFYNMQTQFFDQAIFAWRLTGEERLAALLRPALELHTRWQDECFDPDGDGLYESYINTWPTDSVWYNGGGSCEETCYAYRAHEAARELAVAAGDTEASERHTAVLNRIRHGFFGRLWLRDAGYPAMKREKGGHERLHRSAWLYNCFLPVDVGLTDPFDSATALWYSKWALENVPQRCGGRTVWLSNWVPGIWSVRQNTAGENFQLAYAFFRAGLAEEGYDVLRGTTLRDGFEQTEPGHICSEAASLLARAVLCGLHGFQPDYPNGRVMLAPQYPQEWEHAAIKTPYFASRFAREAGTVRYTFSLTRAACVTVRLPLQAGRVLSVDGARQWRLEPGFGTSVLVAELGETADGCLTVTTEGACVCLTPIRLEAQPGASLRLESDRIVALRDPQGIAAEQRIEDGAAMVRLAERSGHALLFLECERGGLPYYRLVELTISPTAAEQKAAARQQPPRIAHPRYEALDLSAVYNADVRSIYRQQYLSPRHDCVHLALGSDGFSPWTFTHWENPAPDVRLSEALPAEGGLLYSEGGVPFRFGGLRRNIAFTSLWDNWPTAVTVPVGRQADAVYLLLCGSTSPMECGIANAVVTFQYEDGTADTLDIVPPQNFWTLAPYTCAPSSEEQGSINDYDYEREGFCLPAVPPECLQLGPNCRAVVLPYRLPSGKLLERVSLETLSQEVVIGLAGLTLVSEA